MVVQRLAYGGEVRGSQTDARELREFSNMGISKRSIYDRYVMVWGNMKRSGTRVLKFMRIDVIRTSGTQPVVTPAVLPLH